MWLTSIPTFSRGLTHHEAEMMEILKGTPRLGDIEPTRLLRPVGRLTIDQARLFETYVSAEPQG